MLKLYRILSYVLALFLPLYWRYRAKKNKEDIFRKGERFGRSSIPRPQGVLTWIHTASVGESISVMPLLHRMHRDYPEMHFLLTTSTVSAAKIITKQLPERAFHHYVPMDAMPYVQRFLHHWKPDLALFLESEFWPNLLLSTRKYCPILLINGRISDASYARWQHFDNSIKSIIDCFTYIFPSSRDDARKFRNLHANHVEYVGNLKYDAPTLSSDSKLASEIVTQMGGHRIWLAASTHPGEEELIINVHKNVKESFKELLTIIVPRHAYRGDAIAGLLRDADLEVAQRSKQEIIKDSTDVYLVDTMGELGLFYRLTSVAFIGGTMVAHGGHNPIEAAKLDCAIICGPQMENFSGIFSVFHDAHAIISVKNTDELCMRMQSLIRDQEKQEELANNAHRLVEEKEGVTDNIMQQIYRIIPRAMNDDITQPHNA